MAGRPSIARDRLNVRDEREPAARSHFRSPVIRHRHRTVRSFVCTFTDSIRTVPAGGNGLRGDFAGSEDFADFTGFQRGARAEATPPERF
ncbi:MAG: hypothetical protein IT210_16105 [Armatimonadetes bacterium]|nr:hypothetical protein [Armatimonadota bacterium]